MIPHGEIFRHWSYRHPGHTGAAGEDTSALLRSLFRTGRLREYRAHLYGPGALPGLRQALLLDLGNPLAAGDDLGRHRYLWLVEQSNRKVFLYGRDRLRGPQDIGGTVLREAPALDVDSPWHVHLAETAARRVLGAAAAGQGAGDPACQRQLALLIPVERALLADATRRFAAGLDQALLAAVRKGGPATPEAYSFYWTADGALDRRRAQALEGFPFFAETLRNDWQVRRGVERGVPLVSALAEHYGVKPRTIQRCRTAPARLMAQGTRPALLARLDALPAEYLPVTEQDWRAFLTLAEPLADLAALLEVEPSRYLQPFSQGWARGQQSLTRALGMPFDAEEVRAMMRATYRYGVAPLLAPSHSAVGGNTAPASEPPQGFFRLWFGSYSLNRLAELTRTWRERYAEFSVARLGLSPERRAQLTWQPLFPEARSHVRGAYRVIELTSQQDLELEGREQGHCVASYAAKCLRGESSIFSVRDRASGRILSTFEIGLAEERPVLLKHHASKNQAPSTALQALVARFTERVLGTLTTTRLDAVRQARQGAAAGVTQFLARPNTSERALSADERARLAEIVAEAHPKQARRQGVAAFLHGAGYAVAAPIQSPRSAPRRMDAGVLRLAA